jgi:hypothetical protein
LCCKTYNLYIFANIRSELIVSSLKRMSNQNSRRMLKEKAGETAGKIWNALNESEGLTAKQLKKATKLVDKDLYLGLGWLLREDKISTSEVDGELFAKLK